MASPRAMAVLGLAVATLAAVAGWTGWVDLRLVVFALWGAGAVLVGFRLWQRTPKTPPVDRRLVAQGISADGIWDYDLARAAIHYDDRCSQMLGYASDTIDSKLSAWGMLVHPDDLSTARAALDAYVSGDADSYEVVVRLADAQGKWRRVLDRGQVVSRDAQGKPTRIVGIHRLLPDPPHEGRVPPAQSDAEREEPGRLQKLLAQTPCNDVVEPLSDALRAAVDAQPSPPRIRVRMRSQDHFGVVAMDRPMLREALGLLLEAIAEQTPADASALVVVEELPCRRRTQVRAGFALALSFQTALDGASPRLRAAAALLSTANGKLRFPTRAVWVEFPRGGEALEPGPLGIKTRAL